VSANLISLGAVDFGILIDSAVVIVEALMVRLSMQAMDAHPGMQMASRRTALRQTVASLGRPVLFSKAIIILAFLPIFTFQRVEGKIFSPVAFTLAFALAGAVLLTLTLVPALLSWRLDRGALLEAHLGWMQWMQDRYRALLQWSCGHAKTVMLGVAGAMVFALSLIPAIGTEFLPKLDEGNIWLTISLPPASSLEQTKEIERAVRARLLPMPEVKQVITQIGRPDDGTDPKGPNNLELLIDLKPRDEWRFAVKEQLVEVMSAKLEEIPGLPTNFSQVIQDNVEESMSGVKGEIAVKIFGPDLDILEEKAEQVESVLRGVRGATDVAAIKVSGQAELTVVPDRRKLARYGISTRDVSEAVQVALGGYSPTAFYEGDRRFDVVVRLSP
jgi:cobalt-zinc-cadmium resistance protein CzcA